MTEQLATLVQVWPPNAQVPVRFSGQSEVAEQVCDVGWLDAFKQKPYAGQACPRLQFAFPYWQRGCEAHSLVGLHDACVAVQVPLVDGGQSAVAKQEAYLQFCPRPSQVFWLQAPGCGMQSESAAQSIPSSLQVFVRHWASELHNLPDPEQAPFATPPRQFTPSLQSTPTSVPVSKEPPGTPVSEPEVSNTTSMFGWWIWRAISVSGLTRAVAESDERNVTATKTPVATATVTPFLAAEAAR
ncbi:MAG: hypothetical protein H7X95_00800 [Deltaproteobacteria bacterium]|nr:hypothetical protein [Deltaproteobacteria bacterium]